MYTLVFYLDMFSIDEIAENVRKANKRIREHTRVTPLEETMLCGSRKDHPLHLKLENTQHTGSFKARGSLNKVMAVKGSGRNIVTASTGNHGLGVARALQLTGQTGLIFLPKNAKESKVERLRAAGADLRFVDGSPLDAELAAKQYAGDTDAIWISPYNDLEVLAGQGTIGLELIEQLPVIKRVFVTVGGGGLVSGIASILKDHDPGIEIVGCLPENSPEMYLSVQAGHIVHLDEELPTLSDGSAGGAEDGSITFPVCRDLIDHWQLVSEDEIASAMQRAFKCNDRIIEGSAGVALAAALRADETKGDVVIICGGNVDKKVIEGVLKQAD